MDTSIHSTVLPLLFQSTIFFFIIIVVASYHFITKTKVCGYRVSCTIMCTVSSFIIFPFLISPSPSGLRLTLLYTILHRQDVGHFAVVCLLIETSIARNDDVTNKLRNGFIIRMMYSMQSIQEFV